MKISSAQNLNIFESAKFSSAKFTNWRFSCCR